MIGETIEPITLALDGFAFCFVYHFSNLKTNHLNIVKQAFHTKGGLAIKPAFIGRALAGLGRLIGEKELENDLPAG